MIRNKSVLAVLMVSTYLAIFEIEGKGNAYQHLPLASETNRMERTISLDRR